MTKFTSVSYPRFVAWRSEQLGLSLRDLARRATSRGVKIDHSVIWRVTRGERQSLPDTYPDRLDQVVALGDRHGASRPIYVFGHLHRSGHFAPIFDGKGRIGFADWRTRNLARDIGGMLREVPGWRTLYAVPAWPSWLVDQEAEGHGALQLDERIIGTSSPELSEGEVATLAAADVLAYLAAVAHNSDRTAPRAARKEASAAT